MAIAEGQDALLVDAFGRRIERFGRRDIFGMREIELRRRAGVAGIAPIGDGRAGESNFETGVTGAVDETSIDQARLRFGRAAAPAQRRGR